MEGGPRFWVVALALSAVACWCAAAYADDAAESAPSRADALTRLAEKLASGANGEEPGAVAPSSAASADTPTTSSTSGEGDSPVGDDRPLGATPSDSQLLGPSDTYRQDGSWILSTLTSLGLVIALILLARWGWTKMGGTVATRSSSVVEVLSRTTVAPRNQVLLLRVGGRVLVVGDSSAGLRTLANIEDPDEVANVLEAVTAAKGNSISQGFSQLLSSTDGDFKRQHRLVEEGGDNGEFRFDRARDSVSSLLSRVRNLSQKENTA